MVLFFIVLRKNRFAANPWDNINPELSTWLHTHRVRQRAIGTLRGYITYVRQFITFCMEHRQDAMRMPWHPIFMQYWLAHMVLRYKSSVQSMRSWEAAVSWLGLCISGHSNTAWYKDPGYQQLRKHFIREYKVPPCEKYPFTLTHLAKYVSARGVFPGRYREIDYDILLEVLWIILLFITISRPCEILNRPCDKQKLGLRLKDIRHKILYDAKYWELTVWHYKNQKARRVPKIVTIAPSICRRRHCICRIINPYKLLYEVVRRRQRLTRNVYTKAQRENLTNHADSQFFVRSNGTPMTTNNTKSIIAEMTRICEVLEPQCYTEYSLRVGGATCCSAAGIPDALMYRYVGWDPSNLPDIAKRYQRPPLELRLQMQFFMLHGFVMDNGRRHGVRYIPGMVHDPWESSTPDHWKYG